MRLGLGLLLAGAAAIAQNALWVDISGTWRMQVGDDPAYAAPDFDDRAWRTIAIPLPDFGPTGLHQEIVGAPRRLWLRRGVELPPGTDRARLTITLGALRDGYEVWVNGHRIGATDGFDASEQAPPTQPAQFPIPAHAASGDGPLTLALRVRREVALPPPWRMSDRGPYLITYREHAPAGEAVRQWKARAAGHVSLVAIGIAMFGIALLSLCAWWSDRTRREFLWFAGFAMFYGADVMLLSWE